MKIFVLKGKVEDAGPYMLSLSISFFMGVDLTERTAGERGEAERRWAHVACSGRCRAAEANVPERLEGRNGNLNIYSDTIFLIYATQPLPFAYSTIAIKGLEQPYIVEISFKI